MTLDEIAMLEEKPDEKPPPVQPAMEVKFIDENGVRFRAQGVQPVQLIKRNPDDKVDGRYILAFKHYSDQRKLAELDQRINTLKSRFGSTGTVFASITVPPCDDGTTSCRYISVGSNRILIVDIPNEDALSLARSLADVAFIEQDAVVEAVPPVNGAQLSLPDYFDAPNGLRMRTPGQQPANVIFSPNEDDTSPVNNQYIIVFKNYNEQADKDRVSATISTLTNMFGKANSPFDGIVLLQCETQQGQEPCNRYELPGITAIFVEISNSQSLAAIRNLYDVDFIEQNRVDADPVDGGWSGWSEWTKCGPGCSGEQTSFRTCSQPIPKNGGQACSGPSTRSRACPSADCFTTYTDAILNHYDSLIGNSMTRDDCLRACLSEESETCMSVNYESGGARRCSMTKLTKGSFPTEWPDIWYTFYPGWTYYERISK